jgi:hypothetical protein
MHYAAKNLLYTFSQSLDTGFVTTASFKRYAQSPENRTFKNYFHNVHPGDCFIPYLRKRAHYSLSRYITKHRHRKNPILTNFATRITNLIMEKLQYLNIALTGRNCVRETSKPSPLGWAKIQRPFRPSIERTKGATYLSPGQRPGKMNPQKEIRPEKAIYSTNLFSQNKPNSNNTQNGTSRFLNKINAYCLTPVACKNKPISNPMQRGLPARAACPIEPRGHSPPYQ